MKLNRIVCPECGTEYTPGEIFLPKYFLGQPKEVVRDYQGHILEVIDGTKQDLTERYVCNKCETDFKVTAKIEYTTEIVNKKLETTYVQKL